MLASEYEEFIARFVEDLWTTNKYQTPSGSSGHFGFQKVDAQVQRELKRRSGESIKFDVVVEAYLPGARWFFIFECKHYSYRVDVGKVDEFSAKVREIEGFGQAVKPIIVTTKGFQRGAVKQARALGIALWTVRQQKDGEVSHMILQEAKQDHGPVDPETTTRGRIEAPNGALYDFNSASDLLKVLDWLTRTPHTDNRLQVNNLRETQSMGYTDTPQIIHPKILAFCQELAPGQSADYIPVEPVPGAQQQNCFSIVESHVRNQGGSAVYGWQIWEWPAIYLEAEFHAVWLCPDGSLRDLTPKEQPTTRILFLADPARVYGGRRVKNEMRPLSDHLAVAQFIRACDDHAHFMNAGARSGMEQIELLGAEVDVYREIEGRRTAALARIDGLPEPSRKQICWCGSGKKYKSCHLGQG